MSQVFDNIASFIIGGMVLVLILGLMTKMRSTSADQTTSTVLQSDLNAVTDIIDNDFRKIGYLVPVPADSSFRLAGPSSCMIKGDFDRSGTIDSIEYFLGSTVPAGNYNQRTRALFRRSNLTGVGITKEQYNVGAIIFNLAYYDSAGIQLPATPPQPHLIRSIKINLILESTHPSKIERNDTVYAHATWERVFRPMNLR